MVTAYSRFQRKKGVSDLPSFSIAQVANTAHYFQWKKRADVIAHSFFHSF